MNHKGFLLVLVEAPAALEDEFNAWYDTEHLPERLAVPGIETGQRYVCLSGAPRYLALYDTTTPEVFDSPAYLRVSFDNASPWTKRVTSRTRVQRMAGRQVYPGHAVTGRTARALLLRFSGLTAAAEGMVVAGMRANFDHLPQVTQLRVFAQESPTGVDFYGFVEARAPLGEHLDLGVFGACADALDLINTYARY